MYAYVKMNVSYIFSLVGVYIWLSNFPPSYNWHEHEQYKYLHL